jgi:cytidylate kinase
MRAAVIPNSRKLSDLAERQMRNWAIGLQTQQRLAEQGAVPAASAAALVRPYVAISREAGAGAIEIAELVSSRTGWNILDRELINHLADDNHWSRIAIEWVDERGTSWFHESFGKWLDPDLVSQSEYVSRLTHMALLAAHNESMIFVGRGVQFILPPEAGLTVRVIAPKPWRVERAMAKFDCGSREAEKIVNELDKGRADFVRRYFRRDVADPHLYDLVINLQHTSRKAAAELILESCRLRFGSRWGDTTGR